MNHACMILHYLVSLESPFPLPDTTHCPGICLVSRSLVAHGWVYEVKTISKARKLHPVRHRKHVSSMEFLKSCGLRHGGSGST